MTAIIPFKNSEEIKAHISGVDADLDLDNMRSSFIKAIDDVRDVISPEVWDKMMEHYNSTNFGAETSDAFKNLNKLVDLVQYAHAHFSLHHHFIWLTIHVSNESVTVVKSDRETTAYKYLTDEAQSNLIDSAWVFTSKVIDHINKIEMPEWTNSSQCEELKNEIFEDYKEFQRYFDISYSAYFYIRLRHIIARIKDDEVNPRYFEEIDDAVLKRKLKRAVAYRAMSEACLEYDFFMLPRPIRAAIANEMSKNARFRDVSFVKESLHKRYGAKADQYFDEFEREIIIQREKKELTATGSSELTEPYSKTLDENQSYGSAL